MKESAVNIVIWDLTGAPLSPYVILELERCAQRLVKQENLVYNIVKE